jgi:hypothetical protein
LPPIAGSRHPLGDLSPAGYIGRMSNASNASRVSLSTDVDWRERSRTHAGRRREPLGKPLTGLLRQRGGPEWAVPSSIPTPGDPRTACV